MNKGILIGLAVLTAIVIVGYAKFSEDQAVVNQVTTVAPNEQREAAFQESQTTSTETTVGSIEQDLNNTIIQDEDFSDLE